MNPPRTIFGNAYTLAGVAVNATAAGANIVLPAIPGKAAVLLYGDLVASGAVTVTIESTGGQVLDGPFSFAANGGKIYPEAEHGHFQPTPKGEGIVVYLSGAVQVGGHFMCGYLG